MPRHGSCIRREKAWVAGGKEDDGLIGKGWGIWEHEVGERAGGGVAMGDSGVGCEDADPMQACERNVGRCKQVEPVRAGGGAHEGEVYSCVAWLPEVEKLGVWKASN
jgi:hypothetical protein